MLSSLLWKSSITADLLTVFKKSFVKTGHFLFRGVLFFVFKVHGLCYANKNMVADFERSV